MTMLRDIALVENGRLESTDSRVGVLASEIPVGTPLPAFLLNDIDANAPNRLYSLKIISYPSAGDIFLNKAGVGTFTGAPAGTYTGNQIIEKFDPNLGLVSRANSSYTLILTEPTQEAPKVTAVVISPRNASGSQKFTAEVQGTNEPPQGVIWTKTGPGVLSDTGDFVAPAQTITAQVISIKATSVYDPSKSDSVTVIIPALVIVEVPPEVTSVTVTPTGLMLMGSTTQQFNAVVNGKGNISQAVTWSIDKGIINANGVATMPPSVSGVQEVTVTATSVENPLKSGSVKVVIQALNDIDPTKIVLPPARILKTDADDWKKRIEYTEKLGDTFYLKQSLWCIDKDPDDKLYYGIDLRPYLDSIGAGISAVIGIPSGVDMLVAPFVRDIIIFKIGGGDMSEDIDTVNSITLRISCSNGENIDKTIYFLLKQN